MTVGRSAVTRTDTLGMCHILKARLIQGDRKVRGKFLKEVLFKLHSQSWAKIPSDSGEDGKVWSFQKKKHLF